MLAYIVKSGTSVFDVRHETTSTIVVASAPTVVESARSSFPARISYNTISITRPINFCVNSVQQSSSRTIPITITWPSTPSPVSIVARFASRPFRSATISRDTCWANTKKICRSRRVARRVNSLSRLPFIWIGITIPNIPTSNHSNVSKTDVNKPLLGESSPPPCVFELGRCI